MQRASIVALGFIALLLSGCPSKQIIPTGDPIEKKKTPGPDIIPPCEACTFSPSTHALSGTIDGRSSQSWPLNGMTLKLYHIETNGTETLLDTIIDLKPSPAVGGNSINQTINTSVTGINKATLTWTPSGSGSPPPVVQIIYP